MYLSIWRKYVDEGGLEPVDADVSPDQELLASQLLFVRVVASACACERFDQQGN